MINILVWIAFNLVTAKVYQVFPFSEGHYFLGTGLNTCWRTTELEPGVVAHDTFLYYWVNGTGKGICGDIEWTGYHTCSTADTYSFVINDSTFFGFCIGVYKA